MTTGNSGTRRLFAANVRRSEERIDLGLAGLLIASEEYPSLVIEDYLERLDQLAAGLAVEVDLESGAQAMARSVGAYMAGEQGFTGDKEDYYDPRNSYLNQALDRRTGIPITLSVVYMEVARRIGLRLLPVSMPGHFLLKLRDTDGDVFIDPFSGGALLDEEGCQTMFGRIYGEPASFRESMLGAVTKRQVISRMLQNLKSIYMERGDFERGLRTVELMTLVAPWDLEQVRDRGLLHYRVGRVKEAIDDLRSFAQHGPPGPELDSVRQALKNIGSL